MSDAGGPETAEIAVLVQAADGLHARPAIKLSRLAKQFASRIMAQAGVDGPWIDAKSVARLMALKVEAGGQIRFRAEGEDAGLALAAVAELVARDFDEAGAPG